MSTLSTSRKWHHPLSRFEHRCLAPSRPSWPCLACFRRRYRPPPAPGAARYATAMRRGTSKPHLMRRHQIRQCASLCASLLARPAVCVLPCAVPSSACRPRPFPQIRLPLPPSRFPLSSFASFFFLQAYFLLNIFPLDSLLFFHRGIHFARVSLQQSKTFIHTRISRDTHTNTRAPAFFRHHQALVSVVVSFRRDLKTWP